MVEAAAAGLLLLLAARGGRGAREVGCGGPRTSATGTCGGRMVGVAV